MYFKSKIISLIFISLVFSFLAAPAAFAFSFSGFDKPLKPYEKEDKQGKEQIYNWYVSLGLGESWSFASGHLGEDYVLRAQKDVDGNNISKAEIGQPVYSIADGVVFQVANWPECGKGNHGWGGVVLIKHQIPEDVDEKFNLTGTILLDPRAKDKKAEKKRVKKSAEKGTKIAYSMYGHLKNISVKNGQLIKKRDKIGEIGNVCKRNSANKYSPHLHFEIKNQEAIDEWQGGIGFGYSKIPNHAPNRYIPSKFIENNKNLIITEEKPKSITEKIKEKVKEIVASPEEFVSEPEGLISQEENLSFWDKINFSWKDFVANLKEFFGGNTGEIQVSEPLSEKEILEQTSTPSPESQKKESSPAAEASEKQSEPPKIEIWNQKFISYILKEENKEKGIYQITLKFQNIGNTIWTPEKVSLNVVGGYHGVAAKFYHSSWATKLRPTKLNTTVKPGGSAWFTFLLKFPEKSGEYYPQFRPVRYVKETNSFSWIGSGRAMFLIEIKKTSLKDFSFAAASASEIAKNDKKKEEKEPPTIEISELEEPEPGTEQEIELELESELEEKPKPKIVFKNITSPQSILSFKIEWGVENEDEIEKYNFGLWNEESQKCEIIAEINQAEYFFKGEDEKTYIFCVQAIDKEGNKGEWTKTKEITIDLLPTAYFDYFPTREDKGEKFVAVNETIIFDAIQSESSKEDRKIISYKWSFGDESEAIFEGEEFQKIEYLYSAAGDYIVTLTIKDDAGKESVVAKPVKVRKITVQEEWNKIFGEKGMDGGYSMKQTSDKGYIIVGSTYNDSQRSICLIKIDKDGNELWTKTYGSEIHKTGYAVEEIPGEGYIIGGISIYTSPEGNRTLAISLIKTDLDGEKEWDRLFPVSSGLGFKSVGSVPFSFLSLAKTEEGGYLVMTRVFSQTFSNRPINILLFKTDSNGEKEWEKIIENKDYYYPSLMQKVVDGGYIIVGFTDKNWVGKPTKERNDYDVFLIKVDSGGEKLWEKTYGIGDYGWRSDFALSGEQTLDGKYIITGFANISGGGICDIFLLKTDSEGDEEWRKTFHFQKWDWAYSVKQATDGGYIIVGGTDNGNSTSQEIYIIKTDSKGNLVWNKIIGEDNADETGYLVQQTVDGGYIILGNKEKNGNFDIWLIKLGPEILEKE